MKKVLKWLFIGVIVGAAAAFIKNAVHISCCKDGACDCGLDHSEKE